MKKLLVLAAVIACVGRAQAQVASKAPALYNSWEWPSFSVGDHVIYHNRAVGDNHTVQATIIQRASEACYVIKMLTGKEFMCVISYDLHLDGYFYQRPGCPTERYEKLPTLDSNDLRLLMPSAPKK